MGTSTEKLLKILATKAKIKEAIEKKGQEVGEIPFAQYPAKIDAIGGSWTGHADAEGLKKIGWTEEDIAYYQKYGVNWNKEDDSFHKVPAENIALYGVINASNIQQHKQYLYYLPKIDTSNVTDMGYMFENCFSLTTIPQLDTSKVTFMRAMFYNCNSLTSIPQLDTSNVTGMNYMFENCNSLTSIPQLDTSNVTDMNYMFENCFSLTSIPQLDTSNVTDMNYMFENCNSLTSISQLDTSKVIFMRAMFYGCFSLTTIPLLDTSNITDMYNMFNNCNSLTSIPQLDTSNVTDMGYIFQNCNSLTSIPQLDTSNVTDIINMFENCFSLYTINLKGVKISFNLSKSNNITKESLLYIINNAQVVTGQTMTLGGINLAKLTDEEKAIATGKGWTLS